MVDISKHLKSFQTYSNGRTESDALHELSSYGLEAKSIIADGEIHRVRDKSKPGANDNGWYILYETDGIYHGAYGSWSRGESIKFCSVGTAHLTAEQSMKIKRQQKEAQDRAERLRDVAANKAVEVIENAPPANPEHPYLVKKRVKPHEINQQGQDLLIPVMNILGEIRTYQRIAPTGSKLFLKDGEKRGNFFRIGVPGKKIFIAEGYATGATIHELTGHCVYIAFDSGNLKPVCEAVRNLHTSSDIVVAADNDQWTLKPDNTPYNPGLESANACASSVKGCSVVYPSFKDLSTKPTDFNDLFILEGKDRVLAHLGEYVAKIQATPLGRLDLTLMPKREFLYGSHLIRKYCAATLSPGGIGKTQLVMTDAIAIAAGRTLLHDEVYEQARTWHYNLEDPMDELMRRAAAICQHHGIHPDEIADDFFLNSGRDQKLIVLEKNKNGEYARPHADELYKAIKENNISVLSIDPFVKVHYSDENSNKDIDEVTSIFAQIANDTGCAIDLVHHTKKPPPGGNHAGNMDSARGASALAGAVRSARTLSGMTEDEAEGFGVAERRSWYLRIDNAKANMTAPADQTNWLERHSIELPNGDHVGVIGIWVPPRLFNQLTVSQIETIMAELKINFYSPDSRGGNSGADLIVKTTNLNPTQAANVIKVWLKSGMVFKKKDFDQDRRENRMRLFPKL